MAGTIIKKVKGRLYYDWYSVDVEDHPWARCPDTLEYICLYKEYKNKDNEITRETIKRFGNCPSSVFCVYCKETQDYRMIRYIADQLNKYPVTRSDRVLRTRMRIIKDKWKTWGKQIMEEERIKREEEKLKQEQYREEQWKKMEEYRIKEENKIKSKLTISKGEEKWLEHIHSWKKDSQIKL